MNTDTIRQFPLFAGLPEREIEILAETIQEYSYQPGEILFREGSPGDYFFILLDGEVEIVKAMGTADERQLAIRGQGSMLGEMSLFSRSGSRTASMRAHTPLRAFKVTFEQLNTLLHRHPELSFNLLRLITSRLEESENQTIVDLREKNRQLTLAYQELQAAQAAIIEKEKLEHELQIASKIQQSILPERLPDMPGLDFGALMIPARQVGGDFYDFIPLDKNRIALVVGDVCDKGVPAALFMALSYSSLRTEATRHKDPKSTLRAVNRHLLQINRSEMFVTLLYGILDCSTCTFVYARAGHPQPLVLDQNHVPVDIPKKVGQPVGLFDEMEIDVGEVRIPPGGTLLVYSDGLSETIEETQGSPSLPELCSSLLSSAELKAQDFCEQLWRTVGGSQGESLIQDDFTLVCVMDRGQRPLLTGTE